MNHNMRGVSGSQQSHIRVLQPNGVYTPYQGGKLPHHSNIAHHSPVNPSSSQTISQHVPQPYPQSTPNKFSVQQLAHMNHSVPGGYIVNNNNFAQRYPNNQQQQQHLGQHSLLAQNTILQQHKLAQDMKNKNSIVTPLLPITSVIDPIQQISTIDGQMKTDTHFYDGKLEIEYMREAISQLNLTVEEKTNIAKRLLEEVKGRITDMAYSYLTMVALNHQTFDPSNKIDTSDLLVLCYQNMNNADFCSLLSIQLEEMALGPCIQGRVCRLISALQPFVSKDEPKTVSTSNNDTLSSPKESTTVNVTNPTTCAVDNQEATVCNSITDTGTTSTSTNTI